MLHVNAGKQERTREMGERGSGEDVKNAEEC